MATATPKVKRVPVGVSILPDLKDRLTAEAEERVIGPAALVEMALKDLYAKIDAQKAAESTPASE